MGFGKKHGIQFDNKNSLIRYLDEIIFSGSKKIESRYIDNDFDESMTKEPYSKLAKKSNPKLYFIILGATAVTIMLSLIFLYPYLWYNTLNNEKETNDSSIESRTISTNQSHVPIKINNVNKEKYILLNTFGSLGNKPREFNNPSGIAIDHNDNVYIADSQNNRIQKFADNGTYITKLFFQEKAQGQKLIPSFVSVDSENNVYVADAKYDKIQKFNNNGSLITEWKSDNVAGIIADSKSTVYATDYVNDHIHVFVPKVGSFNY
jgi:hypothetical protein